MPASCKNKVMTFIELAHAIMALITHDPGKPVQMCSLVRTFSARINTI